MADALKEGEDYYLERGFLVFTEVFLKRRGYCCESGCRHCPWGFRNEGRTDEPEDREQGE
ncbi:MAG TPA: DUF5522 domain-containing protein [Thermoanaerobaculia bacterium]|nr:DUF5522 domain-containing protein [Thermoanaerobaculia bacterium]